MIVITEGVACDLKIKAHFRRDAGLVAVVDLVALDQAIAGKTQPETVIAVIGVVVDVAIARTESGFKSDIWAVRAIILFEEVIVAGHRLKRRRQAG